LQAYALVEMLLRHKRLLIAFCYLLSTQLRCHLPQVNCLQEENALLEHKQKELKETIQSLLQSRESFVNAYEVLYSTILSITQMIVTFVNYHFVEERMKMGKLVK
jgi:hypothetical protein